MSFVSFAFALNTLFSHIQGITIESLLVELSTNNSLLQCWDEFDTLLASFGLYKGGSGCLFDRSLFLTIYNGKDFQHKAKSYTYDIRKPRLNYFVLFKFIPINVLKYLL